MVALESSMHFSSNGSLVERFIVYSKVHILHVIVVFSKIDCVIIYLEKKKVIHLH